MATQSLVETDHGAEDAGAGEPAPGSRAAIRRERLLGAARALFAEHGFHGTGIAQIATASGVRVGQIYRDFAGKEDIVAALVAADLASFLDEDALDAAVMVGDRDGARAWIADLVLRKVDPEHAPLLPEILAESSRNARIAEVLRVAEARVRACLLRALDLFAPDPGKADQRALTADLILTLMTGLCSRRMAQVECMDLATAQRLVEVIDREIAALAAD